MQKFIFPVVILGAIIFGSFFFRDRSSNEPAPLDTFAECLSEKGAVMYGADWCPHCQNEKKSFGRSFRFINYVECPDDPKRCLAMGIGGYPTWIFPDGRKLEGEQGTEKLSQESGCPLKTKD